MTREEAYTLLEVMATNITGELVGSGHIITEQTKLLAKQLDAIDMAIEALQKDIERYEMVIRASERHLGLVRCKDCRHYLIDEFTSTTGWCYEIKNSVYEDDYCSYGERREP